MMAGYRRPGTTAHEHFGAGKTAIAEEELQNEMIMSKEEARSSTVAVHDIPIVLEWYSLHQSCALGWMEDVHDWVAAAATTTSGVQNVVDLRDSLGRTPLMWAVMGSHMKIALYLVNNGATIHLRDHQLRTALHWASDRGYLGLVQFLVSAAELRPTTTTEATTLSLWLEYRDVEGLTAADLAHKKGHGSIEKFLRSKQHYHQRLEEMGSRLFSLKRARSSMAKANEDSQDPFVETESRKRPCLTAATSTATTCNSANGRVLTTNTLCHREESSDLRKQDENHTAGEEMCASMTNDSHSCRTKTSVPATSSAVAAAGMKLLDSALATATSQHASMRHTQPDNNTATAGSATAGNTTAVVAAPKTIALAKEQSHEENNKDHRAMAIKGEDIPCDGAHFIFTTKQTWSLEQNRTLADCMLSFFRNYLSSDGNGGDAKLKATTTTTSSTTVTAAATSQITGAFYDQCQKDGKTLLCLQRLSSTGSRPSVTKRDWKHYWFVKAKRHEANDVLKSPMNAMLKTYINEINKRHHEPQLQEKQPWKDTGQNKSKNSHIVNEVEEQKQQPSLSTSRSGDHGNGGKADDDVDEETVGVSATKRNTEAAVTSSLKPKSRSITPTSTTTTTTTSSSPIATGLTPTPDEDENRNVHGEGIHLLVNLLALATKTPHNMTCL